MRRWCLYMHENRLDGKKYIGITSQIPEKRWKNGRGYKGCPHFSAAVQKYGWDAFRHEILYTDLSQEEAERLEVELIAKYNTTDPRYGYNAAFGGNTTRGYEIPPEGRRNISAAHVGNRHSEETKAKMSRSRSGEGNHFFGKHHTEEAIAANVAAHGGHAVLCVDTGKVYTSLGEAERCTGVNRFQISGCCNHKPSCITAGGYRWEFVDIQTTQERRKKSG